MKRNEDGGITVTREEAHAIRAALFMATNHVAADDLHIFTGLEQREAAALLRELDAATQPDYRHWRSRAIESHLGRLDEMPDEELRAPRHLQRLRAVVAEAKELGISVPARLAALEG